MVTKTHTWTSSNIGKISIKCPKCSKENIYDNTVKPSDLVIEKYWLGQRKCSHENCRKYLFFIYETQKKEVVAIEIGKPSSNHQLDFDTTTIPNHIVATFAEALACSSNNLFVSASLMIRRAFEEICIDKKANGSSLKEAIAEVCKSILLPKEFIEGIYKLRILGSRASNLSAPIYVEIEKAELDIAIRFCKELMKSAYQLSNLLEDLKGLKDKSTKMIS